MITNNSLRKGRIAEHYMVSQFLEKEWPVYLPVVDSHGVDFIVDIGVFVEVQVKARWVYKLTDTFIVREFPLRKNYFVCFFNLSTYEYFIVPVDFVKNHARKKGVYWVIDWELLLECEEFRGREGLKNVGNIL